jgi:hypothetical protein
MNTLRQRSWLGGRRSVYTVPTDWVWALPQKQGRQRLVACHGYAVLHPAGSPTGWLSTRKSVGTHPAYVSILIKSLGVDATVVRELLRHASFKTTKWEVHFNHL